jgi:hypothetical protein
MGTIIIIAITALLYILKDTITELLSGGNKFAPNQTKW